MGSSHDPRQPAYRPVPPPPRMRWAVVRARIAWPWRIIAGIAWAVAACAAVARFDLGFAARMIPAWLGAALGLWLPGLRLVRVPVEPTRAPEGLTMRERFNLADAGLHHSGDEWDLDTQRRIDALMREGLVEVETVEMPSARKGDRHG